MFGTRSLYVFVDRRSNRQTLAKELSGSTRNAGHDPHQLRLWNKCMNTIANSKDPTGF